MINLLFKALRYSGMPFLFRNIFQRNKVSIFMLHDVNVNTAEKIFPYLKKKYSIIELDDFIQAFYNNNLKSLPNRSAIITFDDGHIGNHAILPQIKKYKLPITIFLCSEIVNTNRHYWFKYDKIGDKSDELKKLDTTERLKILKTRGFTNEKEFDVPQALQKEHIEEMKPFVNFQSHTKFHPILPKCNDDLSKEEIFESKTNLELYFNLSIDSFAYPNGNYSEREVEFLKDAGYKCAVTVEPGYNSIKTDIFRLKRISLNDSDNMDEIIVKSSGVWMFIKRMAKF